MRLRGGVLVGPTVNAGVAERHDRSLVTVVVRAGSKSGRMGLRHLRCSGAITWPIGDNWLGAAAHYVLDKGLAVRVDRCADGTVAHVVPHGSAVAARRHRIVVITEELGGQPVGTGGTSVADRAAMQRCDRRRSELRNGRRRALAAPRRWSRATGRGMRCRRRTHRLRRAQSRPRAGWLDRPPRTQQWVPSRSGHH